MSDVSNSNQPSTTTSSSKQARSNAKQRLSNPTQIRFRGPFWHLTYAKHHFDLDKLFEHWNRYGGGLKTYAFAQETGEAGTHDHTHAMLGFKNGVDTLNVRFFDYEGCHPNIVKCDRKHANNTYYYLQKEKGNKKFSECAPLGPVSLIEQIREAPTLYEACEIAGVEIRTVADVKAIRQDVAIARPRVRKYPEDSWICPIQVTRVLVLLGESGTGKTQRALAMFHNPLLVRHIDRLKSLTPKHDGVVFDDLAFRHWPRESVIHLLDFDEDSDVNCRHYCGVIPAGMPRVFCTNRPFDELFPDDAYGAIERRITEKIQVNAPLFKSAYVGKPYQLPRILKQPAAAKSTFFEVDAQDPEYDSIGSGISGFGPIGTHCDIQGPWVDDLTNIVDI